MKNKQQVIEEFVQTIFIIFGALCLFFSGVVFPEELANSLILLVLGILSLMIRVEYTKEEQEE